MRRLFARSFDNAQLAGVVGQIAGRVGGEVLGDRVRREIQIAVDHGHGDLRERPQPRQRFGDGAGQVDQHGVQQPGGPRLHFDGVFGAAVEIGQAQQPLDDGETVFPAGAGGTAPPRGRSATGPVPGRRSDSGRSCRGLGPRSSGPVGASCPRRSRRSDPAPPRSAPGPRWLHTSNSFSPGSTRSRRGRAESPTGQNLGQARHRRRRRADRALHPVALDGAGMAD